MTRADVDGATILTGQAHHQWADRLTNSYRYGNASSRAEGGDPFVAGEPVGDAELVTRFGDIPGVDLPVMAPAQDQIGTYLLGRIEGERLLRRSIVGDGRVGVVTFVITAAAHTAVRTGRTTRR